MFQCIDLYHDRIGYRGFCLSVFRYGGLWPVPNEAMGVEYRQQGGLGADGDTGFNDYAGGVVFKRLSRHYPSDSVDGVVSATLFSA